MELEDAKKYINKTVKYFNQDIVIKDVTRCSTRPELLVAHFGEHDVVNIEILRDKDTGQFIGG